jgi:hypothetical protein
VTTEQKILGWVILLGAVVVAGGWWSAMLWDEFREHKTKEKR